MAIRATTIIPLLCVFFWRSGLGLPLGYRDPVGGTRAISVDAGSYSRQVPTPYESQWRLDDRMRKLTHEPDNDVWLDDIAVSYEKLERFDEAIEVAKKQLHRNPQRYESLANLGTLYIHRGNLDATHAVLGMMRFSKHDAPILLEVLGELLEAGEARQLAYRAYTGAARNVDDPVAKNRYEMLATHALRLTLVSWKEERGVDIPPSEIAQRFKAEQADAKAWFELVAADEKQWIAAGDPVDQKFNEKYRTAAPAITTDDVEAELHANFAGRVTDWSPELIQNLLLLFLAPLAGICLLAAVLTRMRRSSPSKTRHS